MTSPKTFTTVSLDATVRANRPVSSGLLRLDLTLPEARPRDLKLGFLPGQFAMLNLTGPGTLVFSRPFSILDWQDDVVSFLYRVVGRGTAAMADLQEGQSMNLLGPLGHPFPTLGDHQGRRADRRRGGIAAGGLLAGPSWSPSGPRLLRGT